MTKKDEIEQFAAVAISKTSLLHIEPDSDDTTLCGISAPIENARGEYFALNYSEWMSVPLHSATAGVCDKCLAIYQNKSRKQEQP